ncbi:Sensor histidine kinase [Enhygromyxa salina]|uniref:histidine kinase n=1 Tax=Enhygromyxa salina TaxID=215803 RepID=A0A0C2A0Y1_9BACT|nr:sensor histidine kinase [Enhygromyxa salina]KIG17063.1 Sensor histidine kinase [Enhygromyxa salina]
MSASLPARIFDAIIPKSDGLHVGFERYAQRLAQRSGVVLCGAFFVATLIGWPSDLLLFSDRPALLDAFTRWRIQILIITSLAIAAPRAITRRPSLTATVIGLIGVALALSTGVALAAAGGPDQPWFHTSYIAPLAILPLSLTLRARVVITIMVSAALTGAYFMAEPSYLEVDGLGTVAIVMVLTAVIACVLGHLQFLLLGRSYDQQVLLARTNEDLERRVVERTHRLRQLAAHLQHSRDQERQRLGRNLHDELAQLLTAMRLELNLTRREAPAHTAKALDTIDGIVARLFDAKERLVRSLKPLAFEELGFAGALRQYADELRERSQLQVELQLQLGEPLPSEVITIAICRILQEALSNVARHAKAQRVQISVRQVDVFVELELRDDGVGFEPTKVPEGHFGLLGIGERVEALGGQISIESKPGQGTRIHVRLPPAPADASFA